MATVHYKDILFYWGFENSLTVEKSFGDTTATAQSAATFAAPPTKAGVASSMPGSYSGSYPTPFDCHTFVVSNGDIVDHISGRVGFYVYIDTWADDDFLWNCSYNSSNQIYLALTTISTVKQIQLHYRSGGGDSANVYGGTLAEDAWYFIEAKWNLSGTNPNLELFINGSSVGTATDAQGAWAATPTLCGVGTPTDLGSVIYVDQLIHSNDPARDLYAIRDRTDFLSVTTVVDPDSGSGYDYDSLSDWESDLGDTTSGDLPAYNEIAVAKCRCTGGTADDGSLVTIESFTTDPSHYLKVWTDPAEGYRHNGTYQTGNKYRLEATTIADWHWGVRASAQNIVFDGIQLKYTYSHTQVLALGLGSRGSVQNSIVWGVCSTASCICDGILLGDTSLGCGGYAINNIVYGFKDSNDSQGVGINNAVTWLSENTYMLNNTVVGCHVGISGAGCFVFNNLCSGCTDGFLDCEADDAHCDYNASSVSGDAPGTHSRNNQTFTFAGASDYHLAASDAGAKGYGLNLYNHSVWPFQTDIDGQDRGASWDIGADEYVRTVRLRFLLDAAGDPAAAQFQLEYRYKPNEGSWGNWAIVPESEP